ncbi:hypothetical protein [Asticcacaulis excentricus]|uniref:Phage protein n=1 Tax=Asticcacaulis excentricus TaxID=78587 RepID=A0A3G9G6Q0_9CAUL|nr:hypothetical protein [Asticcacaulis excentricus]BBF79919.1 hypothetical protein EM6_0496 [Asticcacaulis excentricus]
MFKNNFTSGELCPDLWGRSDLAQFQNGAKEMLNLIPQVTGPARRRAGFWFAGATRYADKPARLIEYVRALDEAYVIEIGDGYTGVWGVDGVRINLGGEDAPYIPGPYADEDLSGLRWKQMGDVIVFFHADGRKPKRLQKVSETSWNWGDYVFEDGPWFPENTDASKTISASAEKGSVTLTATFPAFHAGMEGAFFKLRSSTGLPGIQTWQSDYDPIGNEMRLSNGRVYYATNAASGDKTGNTPPQHDRGNGSDGVVDWTYLHDNSGVVQITSVLSATSATATVIRTLPTLGALNAGKREYKPVNTYAIPDTPAWSESMYSDYRGWPSAWPELREERLIVGGSASAKDRFNASQSAGYYADKATFTPGLGTGTVQDDDAIQGFVGDDSFKAQAFVSTSLLIALTHGGEGVIVGDTGEAPLTPGGAKPRALSRFGCADVRPVKAQESVIWVTRGSRSIRDLTVSAYDYPGVSTDLSFIAKHIADKKFVEIAYAAAPYYQLWTRQADNSLASFVYNREQNIKGWTQQQLAGGMTVESLCVVPDALGNDRLWIVAKRRKGGADQRFVLWMSDPDDRMRLDLAGRRYDATPTGTVTVGAHLNGETLTVLIGDGDGRFASAGPNIVVSGGSITLPMEQTAKEIIWGLPYTWRYRSLPFTADDRQGRKFRPTEVSVAFEGVFVRASVEGVDRWDWDVSRDLGDTEALTPRHRVETLNLGGADEEDPCIVIEGDDGFDFILKSIQTVAQ